MIQVTPTLFRGPHPQSLADIPGIKTSLNLESELGEILQGGPYLEDQKLEAAGIQVDHVPIGDILPPTQAKLDAALQIITSAPGPVYVHCMTGVDRTGAVIAYYRVKVQKWTADQAVGEMIALGFHLFPYGITWLPTIKKILKQASA